MIDELPDDWWVAYECATYLDIEETSWTSYVSRGQAPQPDRRFNRTPVWRPETIKAWDDSRKRGRYAKSGDASSQNSTSAAGHHQSDQPTSH